MTKNQFLIVFLFLQSSFLFGQDCHIIRGYIESLDTHEPIPFASISSISPKKGTSSDKEGGFQLRQICSDTVQIQVSYLGYATQRFSFILKKDTTIFIHLSPLTQIIDDLIIIGKANVITNSKSTLNEKKISENASKNLSNLLESISGVSTLKNGSSISKPVIHGLYGNRLTILNNGIAQSGQQWGNDHSPEIDPLAAQRISVIKGTSALAYQGNSLGSVVLIEPSTIQGADELGGKINYFYESNGRGHGLNAQLQQSYDAFSWRVIGTLKKKGDQNTADYFLTNTGNEEANLAVQLEKNFSDKWQGSLYFSTFNTNLGVLRGSHIGNLTDLETALESDEPFFTEENFSYDINAPYQNVNHHLLKLQSKYFIDKNSWLDLTYGGQLNIRKEFDVRRGGRTEVPSLSLNQSSNFVEAKYQRILKNDWQVKTGLQLNFTNNKNESRTGILPLIPNYTLLENGTFLLFSKEFKRFFWEFGARYDYSNQRVAAISETLPLEIVNYNSDFHNVGASTGLKYAPSSQIEFAYNIGLATRNPAINELYSRGLHQGVSGIEEGNASLEGEQSIKMTFSIDAQLTQKWRLSSLFYYQNINDYIFLNPQNEVRLTIRGAFPVFRYEQTNAQIYGLDIETGYDFSENFNANLQYSFIRGDDLTNNLPLINMPSNNLSASFSYKILEIGRLKNLEITVSDKYVFEQSHLLAFQDFVLPPDAYNLVGLKISTDITLGNSLGTIYISADNLLNVAYRDYLNRQRYFADDLGRNIVIGGSWKF
jgi:iron complex outermembrane receptor protein